ncbi:MAG: undecaprenyl-diphosphate phosphatase [Eubacteriales bacterium]|nr:undecaprenyl-diphosphate phosphatase [Eubacteriales bacterium]MDD4390158.1 undecaprenyl-diphosphate phosphatase [Eubacteriales bacterium]
MTLFEAIILGLVQGLSEFLPISSSGHLALMQYFFKIEGESVLAFAVLMHVGTLFSVFIAYWGEIWALIKELGATFKDIFTGKGPRLNSNPTRKLGAMIIVATIPTAIIGLLGNDIFSAMYLSLPAIGTGLLITGTILWFAERMENKKLGVRDMKYSHAILVGAMQGVAICPGISRSGSTLVGGLLGGLDRAFAIKFAFLISIPCIMGSVILEAPAAFREGFDFAIVIPVLAGIIVAAVSGFIAIKGMIKIVSDKKLYYFSFYTWILGAAVLGYNFFIA